LEVPDELMGKRVKCPACKLIFTAAPPGAPPAGSPRAGRQSPDSKSEVAVRRGSPKLPPFEIEEEDEEQPRVRKKAVRRRDEEEEEEEEDRPRVRRKAVGRRIEDDEDEEEDDEDEEKEKEEETRPRRRRRAGKSSRQQASSAVVAPAICLMVTGGLGIAIAIAALAVNLGGLALLKAADEDEDGIGKVQWVSSQARSLRASFTGICWGIAVLGGGIQMKRLSSFKSVLSACIFAMLPCNPCCLLGIPFGIWGIVAINRWDVKREFD